MTPKIKSRLAILAALASAFAAVGAGWKSISEARAIAHQEPKAQAVYEALTKQVAEMQREQRKLHDEQVKLAAYFEGYLKATGAKPLPQGGLSVPDRPVPTAVRVLPPVPRPKPPVQSALPSAEAIGLEKK